MTPIAVLMACGSALVLFGVAVPAGSLLGASVRLVAAVAFGVALVGFILLLSMAGLAASAEPSRFVR